MRLLHFQPPGPRRAGFRRGAAAALRDGRGARLLRAAVRRGGRVRSLRVRHMARDGERPTGRVLPLGRTGAPVRDEPAAPSPTFTLTRARALVRYEMAPTTRSLLATLAHLLGAPLPAHVTAMRACPLRCVPPPPPLRWWPVAAAYLP